VLNFLKNFPLNIQIFQFSRRGAVPVVAVRDTRHAHEKQPEALSVFT
jgi:hypothetical protein